MLSAPAPPRPAGELSDPRPQLGVPDHHEHPGLAVLGARGERGRPQAALDELVLNRMGPELPTGPLAADDVEEVGHRGDTNVTGVSGDEASAAATDVPP